MYLSVLKIPETDGFGTEVAFLGASEEESKEIDGMSTAS